MKGASPHWSDRLTHEVSFFARESTTGSGGRHVTTAVLIGSRICAITPHVYQRETQAGGIDFPVTLDVTARYDVALRDARLLEVDARRFSIIATTADRRAGWISFRARADQ